ncbi:MAG TPA: acyl-CoA synthetase [Deltaproteobacteria bacterium]|jgi:acyl-CoA synthetase (AMP-forming)/AMP-acid ligase II|nr:acyl-CoA synthetase [Deltaproteobacteria bacterium]
MPFPDFKPTVSELIRELAARHGDRSLIVLGDRRLSYADAERESALLARGLLATGVGKGTRVGIWMPNGPDWVLAWLAAARIGALVVPINTFFRARELRFVLQHADVNTLLCVGEFAKQDRLATLEEAAPELAGRGPGPLFLPSLPYLRAVRVWGPVSRPWASEGRAALVSASATPGASGGLLRAAEQAVLPADAMILIYSSGSTADPKGAVHTHGAVIRHAYALNAYRDLRSDDRIYSPMPFFWVGGFVFTLVSALHAGATLICEETFEPGRTLELLEREQVTLVAGWPHYGKAMHEHPTFAQRNLSSIRGGNLYDVLPGRTRPADPELRSNSLGMTETCGPHTIDRMDYDLPEKLRGSFGHAVPGLEHRIVDPDTGAVLPPGSTGEICVRGYSVMHALYKVEREDTFDADGFYHTGDAGSFNAEGILFFHGRLGEMIKTGGANVSPREVEQVLIAQPEVEEAYVVGLPDRDRGQLVAAAVVAREHLQLDLEALRLRVKRELSAYKVPRHLVLLRREELPMTSSGKVDKRRLVDAIRSREALG